MATILLSSHEGHSSLRVKIALVGCVKTKRPSASRAEDLYTSPLFRALREFAIKNADAWYILSAEYGLLRPNQVVEPYERTLNKMKKPERAEWGNRVQAQLSASLPPTADVIFLAGTRYREALVPFLRRSGHAVSIPLEGLPLGRQLQRLRELAEVRR